MRSSVSLVPRMPGPGVSAADLLFFSSQEDLLNPATASVEIRGSTNNDITLHPVREEVVTNPAQVKEILARGEASRRTAVTDWNERSSRSHSVFR